VRGVQPSKHRADDPGRRGPSSRISVGRWSAARPRDPGPAEVIAGLWARRLLERPSPPSPPSGQADEVRSCPDPGRAAKEWRGALAAQDAAFHTAIAHSAHNRATVASHHALDCSPRPGRNRSRRPAAPALHQTTGASRGHPGPGRGGGPARAARPTGRRRAPRGGTRSPPRGWGRRSPRRHGSGSDARDPKPAAPLTRRPGARRSASTPAAPGSLPAPPRPGFPRGVPA
jgi:hypothetical protein